MLPPNVMDAFKKSKPSKLGPPMPHGKEMPMKGMPMKTMPGFGGPAKLPSSMIATALAAAKKAHASRA